MDKRDSLYASISAITSGMLLSFVLHNPASIPNIYSDIVSFWGRQWVSSGQLPYVQSFFEYPIISGFILYSARVIGGSLNGYYEVFSIFSLFAAIGVAWSSWKIARSTGRKLNPVFFLMPSIIIYGIYNFDLFHVLLILLSVQALLIRRKSLSGIMLALAIATKLTSIVLIPVYLLEIRGFKERFKFASIIAIVFSILNVPFIIINFGNWLQTYTYLRNFGLEDAWFVWIFQNQASWDYAKLFGLGVMGVLLIQIYGSKASVVTKTFLALTAYLLGTYIYAPQFNLLLIPFVAILDLETFWSYLWDAFNALIILTWFIYPNPTLAGSIPQVFSLLRDIALVGMALVLLKNEGLWRGRMFNALNQIIRKQTVLENFKARFIEDRRVRTR